MNAYADPLPGPVAAEVLDVIDGDTIAVRAHIWPGHFVETRVRLAGVDTPERRGPDCEAERELAATATDFTIAWLDAATMGDARIHLRSVETGSFAGRVIARIVRDDGEDLSEALLAAGLATVYGGPSPWCDAASEAAPAPRR